MKKLSVFFLFLPFLFSCASVQPKDLPSQEDQVEIVEAETLSQEEMDLIVSLEPESAAVDADETDSEAEALIASAAGSSLAGSSLKSSKAPIYIMGEGKTDEETLVLFLLQSNPLADPDFVRILTSHYINESAYEGINHDVAFSQMCLETGFLSFGGLVQPDWNNYCGLGATGPDEPGLVFADPQIGVRAHIQHLKAYATEELLKGELVDPRYRFVRKGSSPAIDGLSGAWAADRQYAVKIRAILERLYDFSL